MSGTWVQPPFPPDGSPPTGPYAPYPEQTRNPFAIPAIVLAALAVLGSTVSHVLALLAPTLAARGGMSIHDVVTALNTLAVVTLVLALAATGLGVAGLTRRTSPRGLVAAALGIGATQAVLYVLGRLSGILVSGVLNHR